jgi:hypothetical protein
MILTITSPTYYYKILTEKVNILVLRCITPLPSLLAPGSSDVTVVR